MNGICSSPSCLETNAIDTNAEAILLRMKNDPEFVNQITFAVCKLFNEIESKINDGASFSQYNLNMLIFTIDVLFRKLSELRKRNDSLNQLMLDYESNSKAVDELFILGETATNPESRPLHSFVTDKLPENCDDASLSEKVTCVCNICEQQIDIRHYDLEFIMKRHLQSCRESAVDFNSYNVNSSQNNVDHLRNHLETEPEKDRPPNLNNVLSCENDEFASAQQLALQKPSSEDDVSVANDVKRGAAVLKELDTTDGIVIKKKNYACRLCGLYLPTEDLVNRHTKGKFHRNLIQQYRENAKTIKTNHIVKVDPNIFTIRESKLYCLICDMIFSNQHLFLCHLGQHSERMKLDFSVVLIGKINFCLLCHARVKNKAHLSLKSHYIKCLEVKTIVELNDLKFCSLCSVELPSESEYETHINDINHAVNVENIAKAMKHMNVRFESDKDSD